MPFPPPVPSGVRINTTPQVNLHPTDHVQIHAALTEIINILGASPNRDAASLTEMLAILDPIRVEIYPGASAPTGWAICDGTAVSRATYPNLFAVVGTLYGAGDGSTTFNLPDLRNRFVAGVGTGTWADALNESGGSKDTTLVAHEHTQLPHAHAQQGTFASGNESVPHTHGGLIGQVVQEGGGGNAQLVGGTGAYGPYNAGALGNESANHTHSTTISGNTGPAGDDITTGVTVGTGTATDTNLPPYRAMNYIIRMR